MCLVMRKLAQPGEKMRSEAAINDQKGSAPCGAELPRFFGRRSPKGGIGRGRSRAGGGGNEGAGGAAHVTRGCSAVSKLSGTEKWTRTTGQAIGSSLDGLEKSATKRSAAAGAPSY